MIIKPIPLFLFILILGLSACTSSDIAGEDKNTNGVRDDVESWIKTEVVGPEVQTAAMALARNYQKELLDPSADYKPGFDAISCLFHLAPERANEIGEEIQARMVDTASRRKAFMKANASSNGKILTGNAGGAQACALIGKEQR